MDDLSNPYAAPPPVSDSGREPLAAVEAETMRLKYWRREAAVKSVGLLYYLAAMALGLWALWFLFAEQGFPDMIDPGDVVMWVYFMVGSALLLSAVSLPGIGLCRLTAWGRALGVVYPLVGLCLLPPSLFLLVYISAVVLTSRGTAVFMPGYKVAIGQTPHMNARVWRMAVVLMIPAAVVLLLPAVVFSYFTGML